MTTTVEIAPAERPVRRAALWLIGLGPFFYVTYGLANWLAAQHAAVPSIVFAWEHRIPFLDWTILPYWSVNLFYATSLFVCTSVAEVDRHGRCLLTAQIVAVTCFILFPLRFTFAKPETDGASGFLFDALLSFDKPYNQAPSLHIALLVILWDLYARHVPRRWHLALHAWFLLIGVSVLTTYQHHFIDIPTGALLGFFCLWLWPQDGPSPLAGRLTGDRRRHALALRYALGASAFAIVAALVGGTGLWLLWPAVSLLFVALAYAQGGAAAFQKNRAGRMSASVRWLTAPYRLGAIVNARLWTRADALCVAVADGVHLGRLPTLAESPPLPGASLVDLTAELPSPDGFAFVEAIPMLDLVVPAPADLRQAAQIVERARQRGPVLVSCALGYSRSAAVVATWLVATGRAPTAADAIAWVRRAQPRIVIGGALRDAIEAAGATR